MLGLISLILSRTFTMLGLSDTNIDYIFFFYPLFDLRLPSLFLYLSALMAPALLLEHSVYQIAAPTGSTSLSWFLFSMGRCLRVFILTWATAQCSIEHFFRNARWLERESAEMFNVWYALKRDRRSLFLVPLLYWGALRRYFPTSGFFELRTAVSEGRVYVYHITWLD